MTKSILIKCCLFAMLTTSLLVACKNDSAPKASDNNVELDSLQTETESTKEEQNTFSALANIDFSEWKKTSTKSPSESEGDCDFQATIYQKGELELLIDSTNCYEYGKSVTYYLVNAKGDLQMVHRQDVTTFYEPVTEEKITELAETIYDFSPDEYSKKSRKDNLKNLLLANTKFDENYDSAPWIIINEKGDDFILGQIINYDNENWYEVCKEKLYQKLFAMDLLPREIPIESNGTVGMGFRGEIRDMCRESIEEVILIRNKEVDEILDYFSKMTTNFKEGEIDSHRDNAAYWKKIYMELKMD